MSFRPAVSTSPSRCVQVSFDWIQQAKLPPGANRVLFVKNLNYQITGDDLYELFGRYGSIRQLRIGNEPKTKGTAFVVFEDVMDVRLHMHGLHSTSWPLSIGEECTWSFEWIPPSRALYRCIVSHACQARRCSAESWYSQARRRTVSIEEEAWPWRRVIKVGKCTLTKYNLLKFRF